MGREPEEVVKEDGNDDIGYARGFGSLEVPTEAQIPIGCVSE